MPGWGSLDGNVKLWWGSADGLSIRKTVTVPGLTSYISGSAHGPVRLFLTVVFG